VIGLTFDLRLIRRRRIIEIKRSKNAKTPIAIPTIVSVVKAVELTESGNAVTAVSVDMSDVVTVEVGIEDDVDDCAEDTEPAATPSAVRLT